MGQDSRSAEAMTELEGRLKRKVTGGGNLTVGPSPGLNFPNPVPKEVVQEPLRKEIPAHNLLKSTNLNRRNPRGIGARGLTPALRKVSAFHCPAQSWKLAWSLRLRCEVTVEASPEPFAAGSVGGSASLLSTTVLPLPGLMLEMGWPLLSAGAGRDPR